MVRLARVVIAGAPRHVTQRGTRGQDVFLKDGLAKCFGSAHNQYSRMVNFREGWRGFMFQGRFGSSPTMTTCSANCVAKRTPAARWATTSSCGSWRRS